MNLMKLTSRAFTMLCLSLVICSGCKKDEARHYDLLPPDPEDVTSTATLSVNIENTGGPEAAEGSPKVIDGSESTKFLIFSYDPTFYIQLFFRKAHCVTTYTLTSANDAPSRDPKNWTISASNDGENWTVVDTQTDQAFSGRGQTRTFEFENTTAYTYYRMNITSIGSGSLFQLAEWRVIAVPLLDQ